MEINQVLTVLKRWIGVIIGVVVVIALGIFINLRRSADMHSAYVRLQLTAPDRDDVRLVDEYRFVNDREEATSARNNFTEIARSGNVYDQTQELLGLSDEDMGYEINVTAIQDSDFVVVKFTKDSSDNLIDIANAHVDEAIKALGNTRALAAEASLDAYAIQLEDSVSSLVEAEGALTQFQETHGIISLEREMEIEEQVIGSLEIEKAQLSLPQTNEDGVTVGTASSAADLQAQIRQIELQIQEELLEQLQVEQDGIVGAEATPTGLSATEQTNLNNLNKSIAAQKEEVIKLRIADLEGQIEQLLEQITIMEQSGVENPAALLVDSRIESSRENLARLQGLESEYNILKANVKGALATYDLVLTKYNESEVRAEVNRGASFVQVVENATSTSLEPNPMIQFLVLGIAAGLALGVLIAFLLEHFYPNTPDQTSKRVYDADETGGDSAESSLAMGASIHSDNL